jgi:hemerythrin superfamily protein
MPKNEDAISLLKSDHRTVEELFTRFENLTDRAKKEPARLRDRIVHELAIHASIEQEVFYPVVIELVPDLEPTVLEGLEEHRVAVRLLAELEGMDATDKWFRPRMMVLIESVRHHVKEEEKEMFPKVKAALERSQLRDIGEALAKAKKTAPTRPHPHAPDEPPLNTLGDLALGLLDRTRDAISA